MIVVNKVIALDIENPNESIQLDRLSFAGWVINRNIQNIIFIYIDENGSRKILTKPANVTRDAKVAQNFINKYLKD